MYLSDVLDWSTSICVDRVSSKEKIMSTFKVNMIHLKRVWVLVHDDEKCHLFWPVIDVHTGAMLSNEFCSTVFYRENDMKSDFCRCKLFTMTGMRLSDNNKPSCPHVSLRDEICQAMFSEHSDVQSEFSDFLRQRFAESHEINVIQSSNSKLTLLVVADADRCESMKVRIQESIVSIHRAGLSNAIIYCSNVECKHKKILSNLKSPKDYCPHFEKIWATSSIVKLIHEVIGIPPDATAWGLSVSESELTENTVDITSVEVDCDAIPVDFENSSSATSSVKYDVGRQRFVPSFGEVSCIPLHIDADIVRWSERRKYALDVVRNADGDPLWNSSGYLVGSTPCDIDLSENKCPICVSGELIRQRVRNFKLHTCIGTVIRMRYAGICNNPGNNGMVSSDMI